MTLPGSHLRRRQHRQGNSGGGHLGVAAESWESPPAEHNQPGWTSSSGEFPTPHLLYYVLRMYPVPCCTCHLLFLRVNLALPAADQAHTRHQPPPRRHPSRKIGMNPGLQSPPWLTLISCFKRSPCGCWCVPLQTLLCS